MKSDELLKTNLFSDVCERCGKNPIPFECGNEDFSLSETGYYHTVPKQSKDPSILMSNGDLVFKICVSSEHPISRDEMHICSNCFLELYGDTVKYLDKQDSFTEE